LSGNSCYYKQGGNEIWKKVNREFKFQKDVLRGIVQIVVMRTGMIRILMEEYIAMDLMGDITAQVTVMDVFIIKGSAGNGI
jgi:type IV secretory pathway VirB10-like protein